MNEYVVTINNKKIPVSITESDTVIISGKEYHYELLHLSANTYILQLENNFYTISSERITNGNFSMLIEGNRFEAVIRSLLQEKAGQLLQKSDISKNKIEIKAPMPGMILKIKKKAGDSITKGETILILEAMKMENDLRAPKSGYIKDVFIKEGTPVEKGAKLFSIV